MCCSGDRAGEGATPGFSVYRTTHSGVSVDRPDTPSHSVTSYSERKKSTMYGSASAVADQRSSCLLPRVHHLTTGVAVSPDGINWLRGDGLVEGHRGAAKAGDVGVVLAPNADNWWTLDTAHLQVSDVQVGGIAATRSLLNTERSKAACKVVRAANTVLMKEKHWPSGCLSQPTLQHPITALQVLQSWMMRVLSATLTQSLLLLPHRCCPTAVSAVVWVCTGCSTVVVITRL